MYEGEESENKSQMDIKLKHVIFEPGKNVNFSTLSSANIEALVPSLY
jgi:hypothetical protein